MAQPAPEKVDRKTRSQLPAVTAQVRPPDERVRDFDEILVLHTPEEAIAEASRCLQCANAPCQQACPLHNDIPCYGTPGGGRFSGRGSHLPAD